jgi:hypothetical protein
VFDIFLKINTDIKDFDLFKKLIETYQATVFSGKTFEITHGFYLRSSCLGLFARSNGKKDN